MPDDMTADNEPDEPGVWSASSFMSPNVCAVAALTLAVVALLGQNVLSVGVSTVLEAKFTEGGDAYYIGWGLATAIQVGIVMFLARRTFEASGRWEGTVGRAAVLVSCIALLGAALVVLAGLLTG